MDDPAYCTDRLQYIEKSTGNYYESAFRIGYEAMEKMLNDFPDIRGAAMPNDALALGAASCLLDRDIRGFYLCGCNGERELLRFPYPVSTAVFDLDEVARLLTERVFDNNECKIAVPVELKLVPAK